MTPTTVTESFTKQLLFFVSIVVATSSTTLIGYRMGVSEIKKVVIEAVNESVKPFTQRVDRLESLQKEGSSLLAITVSRASINYICLNSFLASYNRAFHKEFLRPDDIKERKENDK